MKLNELLKTMERETDNKLEKAVINIILEEGHDDTIGYIENINNYGCASGCVSALIYYSDTESFFDKYSNEILELLNDFNTEVREINFEITKNNLSWFAFESICNKIFYNIEQ